MLDSVKQSGYVSNYNPTGEFSLESMKIIPPAQSSDCHGSDIEGKPCRSNLLMINYRPQKFRGLLAPTNMRETPDSLPLFVCESGSASLSLSVLHSQYVDS